MIPDGLDVAHIKNVKHDDAVNDCSAMMMNDGDGS